MESLKKNKYKKVKSQYKKITSKTILYSIY